MPNPLRTCFTISVRVIRNTVLEGNTMPRLSPDSITHLDGAIVLTRRPGSSAWQVPLQNGWPMDSDHDQGKGPQGRKGSRNRTLYGCPVSCEAWCSGVIAHPDGSGARTAGKCKPFKVRRMASRA